MVRLGDVCEEIKDRIQSSKISVDEYVTTDNMVKDRGGIVQAEYVPSEVGLVEYHKGDVLIANIRPYLKKIWLADHDGGCSSDVVVFRSNTDGLSSEYLYSVLSQDVYFDYVMQKPRGTKMPRGDRDWMKEFRFPLPPLSEQKEIVARLERELAAVEKMKKGFETLAETAKAEFKAELKEVFEEISRGGAEKRRLGDVCETISTRGHQIKQSEIHDGGKYPVVSQSENDIEGWTEEDIAIYEVPLVLFGDHTCVVKKIERPFVVGADGTKLLVVKECDNSYLFYFVKNVAATLLDGEYRRHYSDLAESEFPVPPLSAQREVVARLDAAKGRAEKLEAKAREGVAVCETMRKAILKEAFE